MIRRPPRSTRTDTLFPTRRSSDLRVAFDAAEIERRALVGFDDLAVRPDGGAAEKLRHGLSLSDRALEPELDLAREDAELVDDVRRHQRVDPVRIVGVALNEQVRLDRKSTRLNSSH